jgi:hypothetical protein
MCNRHLITHQYSVLRGGDWKSTPSWGRYYETRINFVCTPNVTKGKPEFIEQVENVYIIEFKTSVVCKSVDVSCVANSQDKHYDLNPLTLTNGMLWLW